MVSINYQKRKNIELFKRFEEPELLNLSKTQNYIPIYSRFFNLNDTNYNNINLNNYYEIVRDFADDLIEEVKLLDEYENEITVVVAG